MSPTVSRSNLCCPAVDPAVRAGVTRTSACRASGRRVAALLAVAVLATCGCSDDGARPARTPVQGHAASDALPAPRTSGGSVTGMPDAPGPGSASTIAAPPVPELFPVESGEPALLENPETGLQDPLSAAGPGADGPVMIEDVGDDGASSVASAQSPPAIPSILVDGDTRDDDAGAVDLVRSYYRAIDSRDYATAHRLWSGDGRSSGQTLAQFGDGFAATVQVAVLPGEPGRIDAGAGGRSIEVPVSVTTTQADGRNRRYVGSYVLRRSVVDGAGVARGWRIASAELRELQP